MTLFWQVSDNNRLKPLLEQLLRDFASYNLGSRCLRYYDTVSIEIDMTQYWTSILNFFSTSLIKNIFFIVNFRICPPCKTPFCQFFSRDSVSSFLRMPVVLIETLDLWGKCSMTTAVSSNCKMSLQNIYPSSWLKKYTSKNTRF